MTAEAAVMEAARELVAAQPELADTLRPWQPLMIATANVLEDLVRKALARGADPSDRRIVNTARVMLLDTLLILATKGS